MSGRQRFTQVDAFLVRRSAGFDLRWFTPTVEIDLCGQATLASAPVLWEEGQTEGRRDGPVSHPQRRAHRNPLP